MHFHGRAASNLWYQIILCGIAFCAPSLMPGRSNQLDADRDPFFNLPKPLNHTASGVLVSPPANNSSELTWYETTWRISDTLSLELTVSDWRPDPQTIFDVLTAAQAVVGKKVALSLVDGKFVQKSANKYNTLLFEIEPDRVYTGLTWGDVAKVVGEDGLPKFFQITQLWHSIDFALMDTMRLEIGHGTIRRWWQPGLTNEVTVN